MAITSGCLARFDSASVVGMDVDVNLALFDPLGDDGPIVVVFLHIVDHQNKWRSSVVNCLEDQKTEPTIGEKKYSLARTTLIWKLVTHKQAACSTFESSMEEEW